MQRTSRLVPVFASIVRALRIVNYGSLGLAFVALVATFVWGSPLLARLVVRYGEAGGPALIYMRLLMIGCVPATYILERILGALAGIVATLRAGDPFASANMARLHTIGWALLALQVLDAVMGASIWWANARHIRVLDWQPSLTGWLGVLVAFVLARVFAQGAAMRDDLAGTV